jgi:hypothetical protein
MKILSSEFITNRCSLRSIIAELTCRKYKSALRFALGKLQRVFNRIPAADPMKKIF